MKNISLFRAICVVAIASSCMTFLPVLKAAEAPRENITETNIQDIMSNPALFSNKEVVFSGIITQYAPANTQTTANYFAKGEKGIIIKVNSNLKQPKISRNYKIRGTIKIDMITSLPYVIEVDRSPVIPLWLILLAITIILLIITTAILSSKKNGSSPQKESPTEHT